LAREDWSVVLALSGFIVLWVAFAFNLIAWGELLMSGVTLSVRVES